MGLATLSAMRDRHPSWRLLVSPHAPLVARFQQRVFLWFCFTTERGCAKIHAALPGTAARNRTMTGPALMAIDVSVPPLAPQRTFDRLLADVAALKARHTAIPQAHGALIPGTLERLFAAAAPA